MSALTIQDLLDGSQFGCHLIAGADGVERSVGWVHVSTTAEIVDWIEPGDLVITNGTNLPTDLSEQATLVTRLLQRGAAGLALGSIHGPADTSSLEETADRVGLAFLRVDRSVPWGVLGRAVAVANEQRVSGLLDQIRIFDTLQARARGDITFAESLDLHSRITGYAYHLVDERGVAALPGLPPLPAGFPLERLTTPRIFIPEGYVVPVEIDGDRLGTLVAVQRRDSPSGLAAVRHVATLASGELADRERRREVTRRAAGDALRQLRENVLSPRNAGALLQSFGFVDGEPLVVARWNGDEQQATRVDRQLSIDGVAHLLERTDEGVELVLPLAAADRCPDISRLLHVSLGFSAPCQDAGDLALASRQAEWALHRAARDHEKPRARSFAEESRIVGWLPPEQSLLEALVRSTLGPVLEYDAEHGSHLLPTLRTYLGTDRSPVRTAAHLAVHKHTVAYRLSRISELTGRDLRRTETLSEFWLALNAYDIVRGALPTTKA